MECRLKTEQPRGRESRPGRYYCTFCPRRSKTQRKQASPAASKVAGDQRSGCRSKHCLELPSGERRFGATQSTTILAQAGNSGSDPVRVLTMRPTGLRHLPPFTGQQVATHVVSMCTLRVILHVEDSFPNEEGRRTCWWENGTGSAGALSIR